jgi:hypothetical protein
MKTELKTKLDSFITNNYIKLKEISSNITNKEADDILNETYIALYNMNETKLEDLIKTECLLYYVIRIISLSANSKTSPYQQKYNKIKYVEFNENTIFLLDHNNTLIDPNIYDFILDKHIQLVQEATNQLPIHIKKIVKYRSETKKSYREFRDTTNSPKSKPSIGTIRNLYIEGLKQIKQYLEDKKD